MEEKREREREKEIKINYLEKQIDYSNIQLKIGLEIHQQLDTGKLFCQCSGNLRQDIPDIKIKRKLIATQGQEGKIDVAAKYESLKNKNFVYEGYSDSTCLVEFDEEPPHKINQEALKIGLQLALMLNAKPFEIIQVMRKTVIDGSNTSGFQRTLLLAEDGFLDIDSKRIGIQSICLEEDSCRKISETEKEVIYRVDRLGIPLIEIATSPDIYNPEDAKKVALKIGEILRTCNVKRGLGTIRQDVNLSILNNPRTEIKGVQEPTLIIKTIQTEIKRQQTLLELKKPIGNEVRKANEDGSTNFLRPLPGKSRMYPETDTPYIYLEKKFVENIKNNLPKIILKEDIIKELEQKGINSELAKAMIQRGQIQLFEKLLKEYDGKDGKTIAKLIAVIPDSIKAHYKLNDEDLDILNKEIYFRILNAIKKEEISKDSLEKVIYDFLTLKDIEESIKKNKKLSNKELEKEIKEFLDENQDKIKNLPEKTITGMLIGRLKGKTETENIIQTLDKLLKK